MTLHTAVVTDVDAETRWRDWQARGAASDRRTAARMRILLIVISVLLAVWAFVQLP
jgi:hypothetical protein